MWALGGNIAGGKVYGRWPGIDASALNDGRDLAVTTDFRQVLAGVCMHNLGLPDNKLASGVPGLRRGAAEHRPRLKRRTLGRGDACRGESHGSHHTRETPP